MEPATGVAGSGLVAELGWFAIMLDKGTAVGLVEAKTIVGGVVDEFVPLVMADEVAPEGVGPTIVVAAGESVVDVVDVAWRSIKYRRMLYARAAGSSSWAATRTTTEATTRTQGILMVVQGKAAWDINFNNFTRVPVAYI